MLAHMWVGCTTVDDLQQQRIHCLISHHKHAELADVLQ
jgi:hypothetical protein